MFYYLSHKLSQSATNSFAFFSLYPFSKKNIFMPFHGVRNKAVKKTAVVDEIEKKVVLVNVKCFNCLGIKNNGQSLI